MTDGMSSLCHAFIQPHHQEQPQLALNPAEAGRLRPCWSIPRQRARAGRVAVIVSVREAAYKSTQHWAELKATT
jgi:hypothetical protein